MTTAAAEHAATRAHRIKSRAAYMGAGLGGLVLLGDTAHDAFETNSDTRILRALFLTLILIAGALFGLAWGGATGRNRSNDATLSSAATKYNAGLVFMSLAGLALAVAVWWAMA